MRDTLTMRTNSAPPSKNILIIGASRGIGKALVERFAAESWQVFAGCRSGSGQRTDGVVEVMLDVDKPDDFLSARRQLTDYCSHLHVVVYNAGITRVADLTTAEVTGTIDEVAPKAFESLFCTNFLGAVHAAQAFGDLLALAPSRGRLVLVSSNRASLGLVETSNSIPYAVSKVALNMFARKLALQWAGTNKMVVAVHPGWVRTPLGGEGALLSPEESASHLCSLIDGLDPASSGAFLNYDGSPLPW